MATSRRLLIIALVVLWVAGLGFWGWAALGIDSSPEVEATAGTPSPTPTRGDINDGFQDIEDVCAKLDLTSLSTATGLTWAEATETQTGWRDNPRHFYGCSSRVINYGVSITVSIGIYASADQAIREYDISLEEANEGIHTPRERIGPTWSRSWMYSQPMDIPLADSTGTAYVLNAQADNLVFKTHLLLEDSSETESGEASSVAVDEILRIGEQIQSLTATG